MTYAIVAKRSRKVPRHFCQQEAVLQSGYETREHAERDLALYEQMGYRVKIVSHNLVVPEEAKDES